MTALDEYGPTSAITEAELLRGYRGTGPEDRDDDEPEADETDTPDLNPEGDPSLNGAYEEGRPIERW